MGHEYVEMRNPAAAVESYRKAVEVSPVDYRAWYGLGQTYEMLHMYQVEAVLGDALISALICCSHGFQISLTLSPTVRIILLLQGSIPST